MDNNSKCHVNRCTLCVIVGLYLYYEESNLFIPNGAVPRVPEYHSLHLNKLPFSPLHEGYFQSLRPTVYCTQWELQGL